MAIFRVTFVRDDTRMDEFAHLGPYSFGEWRETLINVDTPEEALEVSLRRNQEYWPDDYGIESGRFDDEGNPIMFPRPDLAQSNYVLQSVEEVG